MNNEITDARAKAVEHRHVARALVGLSLVFLVFVGLFVPTGQAAPTLCAITGAIGFALMARREYSFSDQWDGCADLWEQEQAQ